MTHKLLGEPTEVPRGRSAAEGEARQSIWSIPADGTYAGSRSGVQAIPVLADLLAEVGSFTAVSRRIVSAIFKPGALGGASSGNCTCLSKKDLAKVVWTHMYRMAWRGTCHTEWLTWHPDHFLGLTAATYVGPGWQSGRFEVHMRP